MVLFGSVHLLFLALLGVTSALPAPAGNATTPAPDVLTDVYRVERCGHRKAGLVSVLEAVTAAIPPALEDVQQGIDSPHGFRAFFKYDGAKQYVHEILLQILSREPKLNLLPKPDRPTPPIFACAQEASTRYHPWLNHIRIDPWIICRTTPQAAFTIALTSYIWICPGFFTIPTKPRDLSGRDCPTIENNMFITHDRLEIYQTYIAIHEMVHFYLQSHSLSGTTDPPEQYTINGCVGLRPINALHNPTSYQSYVAMVQQQCIEAPDPYMPPFNSPYGGISMMTPSNESYLRTHNLSNAFDVFAPSLQLASNNDNSTATA